MKKACSKVPKYTELILPTFTALKELGGSGSNDEILNRIIEDLKLPDHIVDISHKGSEATTELAYQAAWSRTYLRLFGAIENSGRSVWAIKPGFSSKNIDPKEVIGYVVKQKYKTGTETVREQTEPEDDDPSNDSVEFPDEVKPWKARLSKVLQNMDPFGFERLSQRVLRECGFTQVEVTRKTGDGGIDGTGKLRINGIFSFNIAFQCKRYQGMVGAGAIRDFRGSLTTDIEKGVMITTGTFSKSAKEEASNPGKKQIDLIDGDEFMSKIAEFGIGVHEVKDYEIDEEYFRTV